MQSAWRWTLLARSSSFGARGAAQASRHSVGAAADAGCGAGSGQTTTSSPPVNDLAALELWTEIDG